MRSQDGLRAEVGAHVEDDPPADERCRHQQEDEENALYAERGSPPSAVAAAAAGAAVVAPDGALAVDVVAFAGGVVSSAFAGWSAVTRAAMTVSSVTMAVYAISLPLFSDSATSALNSCVTTSAPACCSSASNSLTQVWSITAMIADV